MSANRRPGMQNALIVAIGCDLGQAVSNNRAPARLEVLQRAELPRRQIFREVFDGCQIFTQIVADSRRGFTIRLIDLPPWGLLADNQR